MKKPIIIIGAGPIGCYAAKLLAEKGLRTEVYEEHEEIGKPVQCTGIVTASIKKLIEIPEECIINTISKARIYSPNNKYIEINFKEDNIILDRQLFDKRIADSAIKAGAKIYTGKRYIKNKNNTAIIKDLKQGLEKEEDYSYLIGADGPLSKVAKSAGLFGKREFWTGIQARIKIKNENIVEFYPRGKGFAWVVPESAEIVRLGILARSKANEAFTQFLRQRADKAEIIEMQAGIVPIYSPRLKSAKNNILLVGDAAAQVKATTGGGIIPGMIATRCLADAISKNSSYEVLWKKEIRNKLLLHNIARKVMDRFSEKDYDELIRLCSKAGVIKVLEKIDRDNPIKLMLLMILAEPRLLKFCLRLI